MKPVTGSPKNVAGSKDKADASNLFIKGMESVGKKPKVLITDGVCLDKGVSRMKVQGLGPMGPKPNPDQFKEWTPASGKCTFSEAEFGQECEATLEVKLEDGWGSFICARGHEEEDAIDWDLVFATCSGERRMLLAILSRFESCALCRVRQNRLRYSPDSLGS